MSFREFAATHIGRRFFDGFSNFVRQVENLVEQLTKLNGTLELAQATQQTVLEQVSEAPVIPPVMPCIECQELVSVAENLALTLNGVTGVMCLGCAKEKDIVHDRFPLN
jgi:hypothetical protein